MKENGQVFSCGYGGLGLGETTIETLEPSQVHIDEKVVKIFATQDMAAALTGKKVFNIFNLEIARAMLTPFYFALQIQGNFIHGVLVGTPVVWVWGIWSMDLYLKSYCLMGPLIKY